MEAKDLMHEVADKVEHAASVKAVFGEPVGEGIDSVIPVARVSVRGGGGASVGEGQNGESSGGVQGRGMGMGLNVVSAPVGYIKRTGQGPAYVPIVDRNRVFVAGAVVAVIGLLVVRAGLKVFGK